MLLCSTQEAAIEELMQKSFGTHFLYRSHLYIKGQNKGKSKQSCDLMWLSNGILILFYLTAGKKSIEKQDNHNIDQAIKWNKYWKTKKEATLKGENIYGDNVNIKREEVKYLINISIISHATGIIFHKCDTGNIPGFTCSISENLLTTISHFGGTIIDFLIIIQKYSYSLPLKRHLLKHSPASTDRLKIITYSEKSQIDNILLNHKLYVDNQFSDLPFIHGILNKTRFINSSDTPEKRQLLINSSAYLSDLSAKEFVELAVAADKTIKKTNDGDLSITSATTTLFTNWVIQATAIDSDNFHENSKKSEESILKAGLNFLPQIIYGHPRKMADYRVPLMLIFPKELKTAQGEELVKSIISFVEPIIKTRKAYLLNRKNNVLFRLKPFRLQ